MRKFLFIPLLLALASCATVRWTMGMPESAFKAQSHQIRVSEMSASRNVYYFDSQQEDRFYFYFIDGRLAQVDHGQRSSDIVIQLGLC